MMRRKADEFALRLVDEEAIVHVLPTTASVEDPNDPPPVDANSQPGRSTEPQVGPCMKLRPGPSKAPSFAPLTFTRPCNEKTWQRLAPDCTYEEIREQQESSDEEGEEEMEEGPEDIPTTKDVLKAGHVAELKRVNKIHKENEVYALRVVKIPLRYYSLLSERLATVHTAGNGYKENTESNEASTNTFSSINQYERNTETSKNISKDSSNLVIAQVVGSSKSYSGENVKRHSTDESVIANSLTLLDNGLEECPFLPKEVLNHVTVTKTSTFLSCNGADWGLSWLQLLICALAIGFLGPLLYVFYIAEDSKKHPT
uniref:(California timema) hypothetical protein n=1 Tax=Timema californicum TaxID=61474 RepID=A0A7R9J4M4_TIMCA|nr:unnamed protein product [Timema californicum]